MSDLSFYGAGRQRGFTLVEAAVSLFVTVIVLVGVLALFDFSNKLSRVQTNIADMQQSLRVAQGDAVRMIRMAGRGGLTLGTLPTGVAVAVRNNVPANSHIGDNSTPEIVPGSDVLTIRGAFKAPIYQVDSDTAGNFVLNTVAGVPVSGTLRIASTMTTQLPQNLAPLKDAIDKGRPEALILMSPRSSEIWAVVELNPALSSTTNPDLFIVAFSVTGGTYTAAYRNFSSAGAGVYPPDLTSVRYVGILEEHRFYVRREFAVPNDNTSDLAPKLAEARVYPGTEAPYGADTGNWRLDIADNVFDLQVALGLDTPAGGCTLATSVNCGLLETADGTNDDWMYNGEPAASPPAVAGADLIYIRLNTLARTDRRDRDYRAPLLVRTEDNTYAGSPFNNDAERMYRRRNLRTLIDLRNL